jgi:hypothetical protein
MQGGAEDEDGDFESDVDSVKVPSRPRSPEKAIIPLGKTCLLIQNPIPITGEIAAGIPTVRGFKLGGESLKGEVQIILTDMRAPRPLLSLIKSKMRNFAFDYLSLFTYFLPSPYSHHEYYTKTSIKTPPLSP